MAKKDDDMSFGSSEDLSTGGLTGSDEDTLLDVNVDDTWAPEVYPDNTEAQIRIVSAEKHTSDRTGNKSAHVKFDDPSNFKIEYIHIYMGLPASDDDEKTSNNKRRRIKEFYSCFDIAPGPGGVNLETDLPGKTGYVILGVEDDAQYGQRNVIKKFVSNK